MKVPIKKMTPEEIKEYLESKLPELKETLRDLDESQKITKETMELEFTI